MNGINLVDVKLLCDYIVERGGKMAHLKLQKLLYYVQAFHLAYFDQPIIKEDFQAWLHGPVCRPVFERYKSRSLLYVEFIYRRPEGDKSPAEVLPGLIHKDQFHLVREVIDGYAKLTAAELEDLTHKDAPWINARKGYIPEDHCEEIIPKDSMRLFYKKFIHGERED